MSGFRQTSAAGDEPPFLFAQILPPNVCRRCFNTGIWLTPLHQIAVCPEIQLKRHRDDGNAASFLLRQAAARLLENQIYINAQIFDVARILTNYTSENPCASRMLIDFYYAETNLPAADRWQKFRRMIEELRRVWQLPVGMRQSEPSGYWIITESADCRKQLKRVAVTTAAAAATAVAPRVGQNGFALINDSETEAQR